MDECSVEDCHKPAHCRSYCTTHYGRWCRHGDPLTVVRRPKTPDEYICIDCKDPLVPGENWPEWAPGDHYYICRRCWNARSSRAMRKARELDPERATRTREAFKRSHPLYTVWAGMVYRCTKPEHKSYPNYGGRGITVTSRWLGRDGYKNFAADMGPRPGPAHTLERVDNDGPYSPGNCRWATSLEQHRNRRRIVKNSEYDELLRENARLRALVGSR